MLANAVLLFLFLENILFGIASLISYHGHLSKAVPLELSFFEWFHGFPFDEYFACVHLSHPSHISFVSFYWNVVNILSICNRPLLSVGD